MFEFKPGDLVFWNCSTHPDAVWMVQDSFTHWGLRVDILLEFGAPPDDPHNAEEHPDNIASVADLRPVPPLLLIALAARTSEEWAAPINWNNLSHHSFDRTRPPQRIIPASGA